MDTKIQGTDVHWRESREVSPRPTKSLGVRFRKTIIELLLLASNREATRETRNVLEELLDKWFEVGTSEGRHFLRETKDLWH
jgi:predicted nucleic acid-binding protein